MPPSSLAATMVAPVRLCSIHFNFPGGEAIELRDPESDKPVGASPEWDAAGRREAVAYVQGTRLTLRVVLGGTPAANGKYAVGAEGTPFDLETRQLDLTFDPTIGCCAPEVFRATVPLPECIGVHAAKLEWYLRPASSPAERVHIGSSTHELCTSWKAMTPNLGYQLFRWVYKPLMQWTCEWAAGRNDKKEICDAIIANVARSGLRYGWPLRVRNIRELLRRGGGMCGDWYLLFQQMAHCQGVFVHCRCFMVEWRVLSSKEEYWCAIVICSGGLNQPEPTPGASEFHDNQSGFPLTGSVQLRTSWARRYRFWGLPDDVYDGHCVNFLEHDGALYLYDACFGLGPVRIDVPLPVADETVTWAPAETASFKNAYLDSAVDYVLGSVYNGDEFHQSLAPTEGLPEGKNGMTVPTKDVPRLIGKAGGVTLRWSD